MRESSESSADHGAWEFEPASGRTRWSDALYEIHGVSRESFEPTIEAVRPLVHPDDRDIYAEIVRDAIETKTPFACQHRLVRPDGVVKTVIVRGSFVEGEGVPDRLIGTTQDVTSVAGGAAPDAGMQRRDTLSGLFNRPRFLEELTREVAAGRRNGVGGSVLVLGLDRFSELNEALGETAGDRVLAKAAEVLRGRLRDTDTLARIGGDQFAMVLPSCTPDAAERVGTQLLEALSAGVTEAADGRSHRLKASIGITAYGAGERRAADELLIEAELAMHRAKAEGRGQAQFFGEEMRAEQPVRGSTEDELRGAIGDGELRVQYQPIVSLADGRTVGCEALVRWAHPIRGLVGPGDFVSVAEDTGLISKIGRFVLEQACRQAAEWSGDDHEVFISVNISLRQLTRPSLLKDVAGALEASGLPPHLLCLEVPEMSLLRDPGPIVESLRRLQMLGVRIAVDDFGAGSSSFGLLAILPIDQIKIDQLFIQGLGETSSDRAVVAAVVSLAKELGVSVVAEGVETHRQRSELEELGAELAQGFLFSPARYASELDLGLVAESARDRV